jgi:hypothetical protein
MRTLETIRKIKYSSLLMLSALTLSACEGPLIQIKPIGEATPDEQLYGAPPPQNLRLGLTNPNTAGPGVGGYVIRQFQVPGTSLSIVTFLRGTEISVCAPGDEVVQVNNQPNAWVSFGSETMQCVGFDRRSQTTYRYEPLRLPRSVYAIDTAGAPRNPYEAVPGTQYFVDQRAQYWGADRLPYAILPDGRSCDTGLAWPMSANPDRWVSKTTIKCAIFNRTATGMSVMITEPR